MCVCIYVNRYTYVYNITRNVGLSSIKRNDVKKDNGEFHRVKIDRPIIRDQTNCEKFEYHDRVI